MQADDLQNLLPHLSLAHSVRWRVSGSASTGKREAKYNTVREPLPPSLFIEHFEGKQAVSVQPLLDSGDTCQWGAIDIDEYGEGEDLERKVRQACALFQIPCYIEQSKSGGVHVYIILAQPVMAKPFRRALRKIAIWIGYPSAEVRPAQDQINTAEGDLGSFMVLPGFGLGVDTAYAALSASVVGLDTFNGITDEGDLIDGPSCLYPLQRIAESGGWQNRNLFLYQLGVYFRYKFPAAWQTKLSVYNQEIIKPSLSEAEVTALIGQLEKQAKCHYTCNKPPFDAVCNKGACQLRTYGVAARDSITGMISPEGVTVLDTDPPTWFVTLQNPATGDTKRVKLSTAQLQNVSQFKKRCIEAMKLIPTLPKQAEWEAMIADLLKTAEIIPVPFEMTEDARLLDLLYKYCLTCNKSTKPEDLFKGRVLINKADDGLVARFRMVDFINFMDKYHYRGLPIKDLFSTFTELARGGRISQERLQLDPLVIEVWVLPIDSKYLELKVELDLEDE